MKNVIYTLLLISMNAFSGEQTVYADAFLSCPGWRNINPKAVIVIDGRQYQLLVSESISREDEQFLVNQQSVACSRDINPATKKFSVSGEFGKRGSFEVSAIIRR